jgi:hypothetical protein
LELPDLQDVIEGFDDSALTYRWRHPDWRVDRLCDDVLQRVQSGEAEGVERQEMFARLWAAAHKTAAYAVPPVPQATVVPSRAPIPYLNEPWYC